MVERRWRSGRNNYWANSRADFIGIGVLHVLGWQIWLIPHAHTLITPPAPQ